MYKKFMNIVIIFTIVLLILFIIVTANFFTKDNIRKDTIDKVAIACIQEEKIYIDEQAIEENVENIDEKDVLEETIISPELPVAKKLNTNNTNSSKNTSVSKSSSTDSTEQNSKSTSDEIVIKKSNTATSTNKNTPKNEVVSPKKDETSTSSNTASKYKGFPTIGKIEIPKTGLNIPILSNVTVKGMEVAPCLLYSTGELNQNGNNLITGHNYKNGTIFSNNKNLQIGDKIYITSLDGKRLEYTIYNKFTTTPDDVSYLKRDTNNKPEITLSTCATDNRYRIVILAKLQ